MRTPRENKIHVPLCIVEREGMSGGWFCFVDDRNEKALRRAERQAVDFLGRLPSVGTISYDIIVSEFLAKVRKGLDNHESNPKNPA